MEQREEAVLITGAFGAGKSAVGKEIAYRLEQDGCPYALIDLDFLAWFGVRDDGAYRRVLSENLAAVVGNYRAVGVRRFVLAFAIADAAELALLTTVLEMPVTVVRVELPIGEIERRLAADVTSGRQDDLREARRWVAAGLGTGVEDFTISNERPIQEVASEVLDRLGWS